MSIPVSFFVGLILGAVVAFVIHVVRARAWNVEKGMMNANLVEKDAQLTRDRAGFDKALGELRTTFQGLSSVALKENREEFLKQAEPQIALYVKPLEDALKRYDEAIHQIENRREEAYGGLSKHITMLSDYAHKLKDETTSLRTSLTKSSSVRGRWGEVTLRRIVELAGMSQYCDFDEQVSADGEDGRLRPDMVIHLPGGRNVILDAKAPLEAYIKAVEAADDATRQTNQVQHARAVRDHMKRLGAKSYGDQFASSTDYVIMFLPGESFFAAALETDRDLFEDGLKNNVILTTPATLIALLRTFAMGWQQEQLTQNSENIAQAGKELFERCMKFSGHLGDIKSGLERAIKSYNAAVGSWEGRVIPGARRLKELGATSNPDAELTEAEPVETMPRELGVIES